MKRIISFLKKTFSCSSKNIFILIISIVFISGGAVNNGFSWFVPAIPFAVIFVLQLRYFSKKQTIWIVISMIVVCMPLAWNHSKNNILYPYLNTEVRFNSGWGYHQFYDSKYYSLVSPENISSSRKHEVLQPKFYSQTLVLLEDSIPMHMSKMSVSHADFGTSLIPVFEDANENLFSIYAVNLIDGIQKGTIESNDLQAVENLQSLLTRCLGNLMYWPLIPIIILSFVMSIFR